jgi:hypothetical protein
VSLLKEKKLTFVFKIFFRTTTSLGMDAISQQQPKAVKKQKSRKQPSITGNLSKKKKTTVSTKTVSAMELSKVAAKEKNKGISTPSPSQSENDSMGADDEDVEASESSTQDISGHNDASMHTEEEETDNTMTGRSFQGM